MAESARTYYGPWIHWTYGTVRGSTLTLSSRDGGLFTAFLALFVAIAAGAIWRIVAFIIHQTRADQIDHDALHHQQQATFRNTSSPGRALWEFAQLFYFWRKLANKPFRRSLPLALTALVCFALLGIAGVFSSQVVGAYGHETLIVSDKCGLWAIPDSTTSLSAFNLKLLQDTLSAAAYSRTCYGTDESGLQCRQFFKKEIGWTTNTNGTCPFSSEVCKSNTGAYEMDTGLVDSHADLGVNTPRSDRIRYRKKTSCAILERDAYLFQMNVTANQHLNGSTRDRIGKPGDTIDFWKYGTLGSGHNWTFSYNQHAILDQIGYGLTSLAYSPNTNSTWTPIDALRRDDADVSIIFMNPNSISYEAPIHDPFFEADMYSYILSLDGGEELTYWESNHLTNIMACTDQHQFCNPNNDQCTDLTHHGVSYDNIGLNPVQHVITGILSLYLVFQSTFWSLNGRGSSALRAQDSVHDLQSGALADDQWHIELEWWYATGLARLQRTVLEFAAGASNITNGTYVQPPAGHLNQALCYSQMVPAASDAISFSIAGVAVVLIIGALLIIANLFLDILVGLYQQKRNSGKARRLQWILDEKLQLQRLAYEEADMGEWSGGTSAVPVTLMGEKFGILKDVDLMHPKLRRREEINDCNKLHKSSSLVGKQETTVQA